MPNPDFDPEWYVRHYPDVAASGMNPADHYLRFGALEGRRGSGPWAVFTSFNFFYADRALVLLESIRRHEPSWQVVAVVVEPDMPAEWERALSGFDEVVLARSLYSEGDRFDSWIREHNVVEACTAVKGQALVRLLDRGHEAVIYLDPDTQLLGPLTAVAAELAVSAVVLTPHLLSPAPTEDSVWDGEVGSLKHGVYNLGFLAVRNCPEGRQLAAWWADRLSLAWWDRPEMGLFTDQRWMISRPPCSPMCTSPATPVSTWGRRCLRHLATSAHNSAVNEQQRGRYRWRG